MDFPPTARIDTRLTVLDWPADADDDLIDAVTGVTTFEVANDGPTIVDDGDRRHLVWRGYLTGGLLTLYERLGRRLSELGVGAFYGDPRMEVFVPAEGDVVVLGALRHALPVPREDWDARVATASSTAQLATDLMPRPSTAAEEIIAEARRVAEDDPEPFLRPEAFDTPAPGEVQFDLLEDADCELTERYEPEGSLEAAWLSFDMVRWRTDFLAPLTVLPPYRSMMECLCWRVTQWEWCTDEEDGDDGRWEPRAQMPVTVREVVDRVPERLGLWVRGMTERAIEQLEALGEEQPAFYEAAETLRWEIAQ